MPVIEAKTMVFQISDAWDNNDEEDEDMFCEKWNEYLQSNIGQSLVTNRRRELNNAESYFSEAFYPDLMMMNILNATTLFKGWR